MSAAAWEQLARDACADALAWKARVRAVEHRISALERELRDIQRVERGAVNLPDDPLERCRAYARALQNISEILKGAA